MSEAPESRLVAGRTARGKPVGSSQELPAAAYAGALACLPGVGPAWLAAVLAVHSPEETWHRVLSGALARPASPPYRGDAGRQEWSAAAASLDVASLWARWAAAGIAVSWLGAPDFPQQLAEGPSPSGVLFVAGDAARLLARPCVAVIGTRRCTPDGASVAYELAWDLARAGVCVVSGLALGIDGAAHAGALSSGAPDADAGRSDLDGNGGRAADGPPWRGMTIGVAAGGVDVVYPRRHGALWRRMVSEAAVISEAPPGLPAQAWRFPSRNRVIAGLAQMVVVVECHAAGGSWHTVEAALRRGTEVCAVPGPVRSSASVGTNMLLHQGAAPVRDAEDVICALGLGSSARPSLVGDTSLAAPIADQGPRGNQQRPPGEAGPLGAPGPPTSVASDRTRGSGKALAWGTQPFQADLLAPAGTAGASRQQGSGNVSALGGLSVLDKRVLTAIGWRPLCMEEIVERCGLPLLAVVVSLERLSAAGEVCASDGWWSRSRKQS